MAEESLDIPRPGARAYPRAIFVLQALLTAAVVGWVLDLHRAAGLELYTEQFIVTALGFAIALCFLTTRSHWWDDVAASAGLVICFYVAWRYPTLVNELTERPLDGILIAAALC